METVSSVEEVVVGHPPGSHADPNPPSNRLTGRHFHGKLGVSAATGRHFHGKLGVSAAGGQIQPDCVVCSRKKGRRRKSTTYECKQCHLPMCIVPCFELYHTKKNPERHL